MRLIDADALLDDVMDRYCKKCDKRKGIKNGEYRIIYDIGEAPCRACEVDDVKAELEEAPSAERKKGKWIKLDMHAHLADHKCTACDQECYVPTCMGEPMYTYCPNCGAWMGGNNDEAD